MYTSVLKLWKYVFQRKKNNGSVLNIIKCILSLTLIIVALFEERKERYENMYKNM